MHRIGLQVHCSGSDVVVLPSFSCVGTLVPVSAVSVARSVMIVMKTGRALPEHLKDIVAGSHSSLGEEGQAMLRTILIKYAHVFPAPGEPVTGRATAVQHDIETNGARPVRCGPRRLAPTGLRTEQTCIKDILEGGQIEPSDSQKDGSTSFCVDYRRLNSFTVKDAYPLPRFNDSLRLFGNQQ